MARLGVCIAIVAPFLWLLSVQQPFLAMSDKLSGLEDVANSTFDYIVVGGGTAGCVVANRLSEDLNVTVAVLEAGPPHLNDPLIDNPSVFLKPLFDPEYDYLYSTAPQPGVDGRSIMFPRGRGLGGTSQINWMIWNIPQKEEVEAVRKLGNEGWTWDNFVKYQKKVQRFYPPSEGGLNEFKNLYNPDSVGHDGPVPLIFSRDSSGSEALWQQSLAKHGVRTTSTSLDGNVVGTYKNISNIKPETNKRAHSTTTYLLPALDRPNLRVLTDACVYKILTEADDGVVVASGVEFEHGGRVHTVHCRKEVIVCAGTVKSPHILELSGIGDRKILEPLGIDVKVDLPGVGTNVQEHVSMGTNRWKIKEDKNIVTSGMLEDPVQAEKLRIALYVLQYRTTFAEAPRERLG